MDSPPPVDSPPSVHSPPLVQMKPQQKKKTVTWEDNLIVDETFVDLGQKDIDLQKGNFF